MIKLDLYNKVHFFNLFRILEILLRETAKITKNAEQ